MGQLSLPCAARSIPSIGSQIMDGSQINGGDFLTDEGIGWFALLLLGA